MLSGMALGQAIDRLSTPQIESALEVSPVFAMLQLRSLETDTQLKQCGFVQELNHFKKATAPPPSGLTQQIFDALFPYGPAANALLATLYISGPPSK